MRGRELCRSHEPSLPRNGGAPKGNRNALRHGLYQRWFNPEERQALEEMAGLQGLSGEIAVLRVALARLLSDDQGGISAADRLVLVARGVDSLSRALRAQRVLDGDRANGLLDGLEAVLAELGLGDE